MKIKQVTSNFAGNYYLPELNDKEEDALRHKELHKLRKSAHVQKMEAMVNVSHSVPPTEINQVVLTFEGEEARRGNQAFAYLMEDEEDGELYVFAIPFLGSVPTAEAIWSLVGKTKDQLLQERFSRVPPRTIVP